MTVYSWVTARTCLHVPELPRLLEYTIDVQCRASLSQECDDGAAESVDCRVLAAGCRGSCKPGDTIRQVGFGNTKLRNARFS